MKTLGLIVYLISISEVFTGIADADFVLGEPMKVPNVNSDSSD